MKILYFTDPHFSESTPISRIDNFYETQFDKLAQIWEIAAEENCDEIICGGDLFDRYNPLKNSFRFLNYCIQNFKCKFRTVIGNHDVHGRNQNILDCALGTLHITHIVDVIKDDIVYRKEKIILRAVSYVDEYDPKPYIFDHDFDDYFKIIVTHNTIFPTEGELPYDVMPPDAVKTNADLVLCGHIHKPWKYQTKHAYFVNPGSLVRRDIDENHKPTVLIIHTYNGAVSTKARILKYTENVFGERKTKKEINKNFDSFVSSLKKFEALKLEEFVRQSAQEMEVRKSIVDYALEKLDWAKENVK